MGEATHIQESKVGGEGGLEGGSPEHPVGSLWQVTVPLFSVTLEGRSLLQGFEYSSLFVSIYSALHLRVGEQAGLSGGK